MNPVDVLGVNVDAGSGNPLVLLREHDAPHRVLPIFIGEPEAVAIAVVLSDQAPPRPLTHDLLATLLEHLDVHVDHVELTTIRGGAFLAELCLVGPHRAVILDSRASDAIALALRVDAPVFASDSVLDEAGAVLRFEADAPDAPDLPDVDDPEIDDDVERFRAFLDEIDPAAFGNPDEPGHPGDPDDKDGSS